MAALLVAAALPARGAPVRQETGFLDRSITVEGVEYRYVVYVPRDFDPGRAWPVVLTLHGGGDYGSDGSRQSRSTLAETLKAHPEQMEAIVVFAQAHADGTPGWQQQGGRAALAETDAAIAQFHGDPARVYLTGASAGGNGAWFLASRHPERWAAVLIACGFVSEFTGRTSGLAYPGLEGAGPDRYARMAQKVKSLPIWLVHGDADQNVSVEESRHMAAALKAVGADVRYTELPGADHAGAWRFAFADPDILRWLMAARRR
jgi:predicted peptidase